MLRWLAPRLPPRRYRINLHSLLLDSGNSKVSFNPHESSTLELRSHLRPQNPQAEDRSVNPLVVFNSLPPAPVNDLLQPNSSLCPPFHIHLHENETFKVLSGEANFLVFGLDDHAANKPQDATTRELTSTGQRNQLIGIRSCIVTRGSSITIPRGQIHTFRNASTTRRLELEFGFDTGDSEPNYSRSGRTWPGITQSSTTPPPNASLTPDTHTDTRLAPTKPASKVHADHTPSSTTGQVEASTDAEAGLVSGPKPASPAGATSEAISEKSPADPDTHQPSEGTINTVVTYTNTCQTRTGQDPLRSKSEPETPLFSPHSISTKMMRFFLNTQLYRADCTAHSIPRALPQILLFNHAAGVILVPSWVLHSRVLRPYASLIGRVMNVLVGVVYGRWICGLRDSYDEYTQAGSAEVIFGQIEKDIEGLRVDVYELEQRFAREREARVRLRGVEESGLVCSAWKSHEFDGQSEDWRKGM